MKSGIFIMIIVAIINGISFAKTQSVISLAFLLGSIGIILSYLGERFISKILMLLCAAGALYALYEIIMIFIKAI